MPSSIKKLSGLQFLTSKSKVNGLRTSINPLLIITGLEILLGLSIVSFIVLNCSSLKNCDASSGRIGFKRESK